MSLQRNATVVFAYHNVGVRCLSVALAKGLDVRLVVTHEDDPLEQVWFESVAALAQREGIPVIAPADANSAEVIDRVRSLAPDFLFSFYYRRLLGRELLAIPKRGAFNMHGSLLPKFRGRAPVNWAIIKGEPETGATLHEMIDKPDAGRIVERQAVPILPDDVAIEVFNKVTVAAEMALDRCLPKLIDGTAMLEPQDLSKGSYFGGRKPEDGRIDWRASAREIHNLVRSVAPPYPGAFAEVEGVRVRILRTRLEPLRRARTGGPGLYREDESWLADCSDGQVLRILEFDAATLDAQAQDGRKIRFD